MRRAMRAAVALTICVAIAGVIDAAAPANLTGQWQMNRDLSSAPGGMPGPDGLGRGPGGRSPGGGGGGGGRIGGGFGGGGGGRGGFGGGGEPGGRTRPSSEDIEAQRSLMREVAELPGRLTITQDGDKVTFVESDGVARSYVANGKTEKHQLTHGTIETKSSWDGPRLKMEIAVGRGKLTRTFALRDHPRRLEVTTSFDGAPKDARRIAVYDEAPR